MKHFRDLGFHQLFDHESSTFTYLVYDPGSLEGIIIDPVRENLGRDLRLVEEMGMKLKYIFETHIHADHVTSAWDLKVKTGAKTMVSRASHVKCADHLLDHLEEISVGSFLIRCLATPGHTNTCMSYWIPGAVFTGDALLIRGCGRTDFQQGSSPRLFASVRENLFSLDDETLVFPAHDYKGFSRSSIGLEKRHNPRLGMQKTEAEFVEIMAQLKLDLPKKIHEAVPANLECGKISNVSVGT